MGTQSAGGAPKVRAKESMNGATDASSARQRAFALTRANQALQETIEAFADGVDLDRIVPRVLGIVAGVFNSTSCAFFENNPSGSIFLRYWNVDGRTFSPAELIQLDPEKFGLVRRLAEGFEAPVHYLGIPSLAIGTVMLDHVRGTSIAEFDRFALSAGWDLELNIGIGASGLRSCTLVIYRERTNPFAPAEIALAESLAKQLGLANQFAWLANEAKLGAVALEREEAARKRAVELAIARAREQRTASQLRAQELVEINSQLRDNLLTISEGKNAQETLQHILASTLRQLQAEGACIFALHEAQQTLQIAASADKGVSEKDAQQNRLARCADPFPVESLPLWRRLRETRDVIVLDARVDEDASWLRTGARQWHLEHLRPVIVAVSLAVTGRSVGYFSITFGPEMSRQAVSVEQIRMAQSLASLAAVTIETDRLAKRAQDAAVAEDRNRLAHELHDTLAGAFTGIFMQLQAASDLPDDQSAQRRACMARAEDLARIGLRQVREFVHTLTINGEDRWRAVDVMRKIVSDATAGTGIAGTFIVRGGERLLKATAAHALQRILQEAVGNAQRYAKATNVETTLSFEDESVHLTINDNGVGFDKKAVSDTGFGIPGMRTRVARLAGTFSLESKEGRGTTITVRLPEPYEAALR